MPRTDYDSPMTIGNAHDAALAATCPEDFFLGEGCTRQTYLINGVVYKVPAPLFAGDSNANAIEYANAERIRPLLPVGFAIPQMTMYDDILAAEFVNGTLTGECFSEYLGTACDCFEPCVPVSLMDPIVRLGITDIGYGNLIAYGDTIFIIDCVS